jgi:hypothetical protein
VQSDADDAQVFIVRAWREPGELASNPKEWRGVVVHVISGDRAYWQDLLQVVAFIKRYLNGKDAAPAPEPEP